MPELAAGGGVDRRDVGGAVVGHHPLDRDAALGEPGDRAAKEARAVSPRSSGKHLDVGEPGGVVDADVARTPSRRA